ncbi:hypothetical protein RSAG8_04585, partial [Rhizoctonia solani AG-8 WAC10335]
MDGPPDSGTKYSPVVFGHLVALMHAEERLNAWRVEIYDLRTTATTAASRDTSHLPGNQRIESLFKRPFEPTKSPSSVESFAVLFKTIPWEKDGHQAWGGTWPVEIMVDDEHVVILRVSSVSFLSLYDNLISVVHQRCHRKLGSRAYTSTHCGKETYSSNPRLEARGNVPYDSSII